MKYKSLLFLGLASFLVSADSNSVKENKEPSLRSNFYIGATYNGSTDMDILSSTVDIGPGYSLSLGYSTHIKNNIWINSEIEYLNMGEEDAFTNYNYDYVYARLAASAISLNVKPTYKLQENGFYLSGLLGLGVYTIDGEIDSNFLMSGTSKESEFGYSLGLEAGYEFEYIVASLGYKMMFTSVNDNDVDMSTFGVGLRYKF